MTVPSGTGALEATQQQVLSQLQSGLNVSVTSSAVADTIATGNITAAQPTPGTVVAGGTVSITLGTGQGTWEAQLTGTFSSGTTIIFEGTDDTGVTTNWFTTVGYNTTVANPPNITSVGGPGPFVVRGSASGYQQIRMRASALTVSDNVAVRLIGSNAPLGLGGLSTNDGSFAKESGGHLATIDTNTSNASSALGTSADAAWSLSGNGTIEAIAKKIALELASALTVQQTDMSATGTISAAQSSINTPVSNATVQLALGQGQSTWKAQLLAGGGGFTSGTTIVADKSPDGGTTWYSASFKVTGASPATSVSSVVGPGPLELTGNCSGVTHVRIRCNVLNSTETIAVTLRASVGVGDIGLLSSIPAGSNVIGSTTIQATSGTALLADQSNTELRASVYGKSSTAGDTPLGVDSSGRVTSIIQAVGGTTLAADQSNTELRVSLYGKNSAAGDTPLLVNSDGSAQLDLRKVAGSALSQSNPLITETNIQNWLRNGQGFAVNGRGITATNANLLNCALSIFNPSNSGKNVLVYSIRAMSGQTGGTISQWQLTTSDPYNTTGFTTQLTPVHLPGATSPSTVVSACQTATGNTTAVTAPGTKVEEFLLTASLSTEILTNSATILLPPGNGIAVMILVGTTGNYYQAFAKWIEY